VAPKREVSNTAKLSVFKSIFVPILTCGHKFWVMTERILIQVQSPKMRFLRRVHRVTKGRTEVRLHPRQETSLAPPYLNLKYFGSKCAALRKKIATFWHPGHCAPLLRYIPGVTLRDKVHSVEIRRALNVEPLLLIERTQLR